MNDQFPTPDHHESPAGPPSAGGEIDLHVATPSGDPTNGSRRRWVVAGATAGGLALGAVGLGQLASADDGPVTLRSTAGVAVTTDSDAPADAPPETPADDEAPSDGHGDGPFGGWFEFDEAFGPYDQCIDERVGDLLPEWGAWGDEAGEWADGIEIDVPWGDGSVVVEDGDGLPTWFDFGEGDGSVTVTKTDGTISVESSGDVEEIDGTTLVDEVGDVVDALPALPEFDDETLAALDEAHEACADLLPEGADFDIDLGDLGDLDLGEFPIDLSDFDPGDVDFGEFDLGAFDLDELPIDLDELDLGDVDLGAELEELRDRLADAGIDLGDFGIDADEVGSMMDELTSGG